MANDEERTAAFERSSEHWLEWLHLELSRRGDTPRSRLLALWDALEEWFSSEDFHGSFVASAAGELRSEAEHPAHRVIAAHRLAVRQLLEDLAKAAGALDPQGFAVQLQVLVEGAIVGALVDREPRIAEHARELTEIALDARTG